MTNEPLRLPVPINEAEAMIDTFWDEKIANINDYILNRDTAASIPPACNPRSSQYWCWDMLKWDHAPIGRPIITLERTMNVSIEGYDRLMVRLAMPAHLGLSISAVIDGQVVVLIEDQPGQAGPFEYEAPVTGKRLEGLTLALTSARDQGDEAWLYWIGVANEARRSAMLARPTPFTARWDNFLLPPEAKPEFKPRFGFFFGADDLPAIRRRARSPAYSRLMAQMRQQVREIMAFHKSPEEQVGPYLGAGSAWSIQTRVRDWDTYPFYAQAPLVAFVGLMDEDTAMLRFAARIAVSVAHCRSWAPHFMQDFPGSTWDTRAFPESHAAAGVCMALDWAGGWFTDSGEHLIRYAVTHKALGRMRGTFLQYDYMWDCNQTHLIALGRLLALLVQLGNANPPTLPAGKDTAAMAGRSPETKRGWERAGVDIEQFERDLVEMIDRYVQPDGSSNEGVGYWGATFRATLPVLAALARLRGKKLTDMVSPKLRLMWNFVAPVLSTAGEPGSYVPISDTSFNAIYWDTIGLAAAALDTPGWNGLLAACLARKTKTVPAAVDMMPDGPFTVIYGPDEPATPSIDVPVFRRLETAGMITSNRPWNNSTVRLFLVGAMPNAGHCHPDKGSFILEACGEVFGGDRGVTPYVDPRCRTLSAEVAHNLAVPEDCFQINPSPAGAKWTGTGDDKTLSARVDTSGTWKAPVRVARRTITSPRPDLIEIVDEIELDEARAVTFYLNTPLPITTQGTTATVQGTKARLTIEATWAASASAGEYYCNYAYEPWNRLAMTSAPTKSHLLKTVLRLEPLL